MTGVLTALPPTTVSSDGSPTAPAREASTTPGPGPALREDSGSPLEIGDPAFPEVASASTGPNGSATSATSLSSLFTDASLITQFIEETSAGAQQSVEQPLEPRRPRGRYQWPTGAPATVVEGFDPPAVVWGRGHRGVDLAAAEGTQIRSAAAGTVVFAGTVAGRPVVSVDHGDGIRTTYEPVEPSVSAGETVDAGQVIGTLLPGHRSDGVCALHWGARTGPKTYIDPLRLLEPAVIRLKPIQ
ncbi:M23 family metallopeptidase [Actinomyces johnsonii]|uniref:M23 family metallopeptidase n=1 Tax=Actinomyces johnsonii TaxID=544581 RepID=UPI0003F715CF|nr:M23 family metallopeptidase [Actinomyces johnsonii]